MDIGSTVAIIAEGVTLVGGASAGYAYVRRPLRLQRMLRFRLRGGVDVVITTLTHPPSLIGAASDDMLTTSRGNVIAAARWAQEIGPLKQLNKGASITTHLSDSLPEAGLTSDLVILGGNNENEIARKFLEAVNAHCPGYEVLYDDKKKEENILRLVDPSGPVFDVSYPWLEEASRREPRFDYGLIVTWVNPFSGQHRRAVMCAGFTAAGTKAATSFFFDHVVLNRRRYAAVGSWAWPCFAVAWKMELGPGGSSIPSSDPCIVKLPDRRGT
jgi:hypothetical protein